MQTIYLHNRLGPYRGIGSKERLHTPSGYMYHLDTVAILFL